MGPFPKAKNELQYVIVAIDYMTIWVEAKALRTITQEDAIKFMNENISTRFGIPNVMVSDNGTQFIGLKFVRFLSDRGVKHTKASVCHPQSNGSSTKETPFKLAFGTEALLPVEVGSPSHRVLNFDEEANVEGLRDNIELLDKIRNKVMERMDKYKEKTKDFFAKMTRIRKFDEGEYVLRATKASDPRHTGKLMPKWEGPYKVKKVLRPGSYKLERLEGTEVTTPGMAISSASITIEAKMSQAYICMFRLYDIPWYFNLRLTVFE
ncbi:uncharacterized protein LOC141714291 [Apium graveolens]|uniref:uncharacterized protein LOC141714291 n=1 Tax=Apium graveolens TaxID=4045 RepID=UPI003D7997AA